MTSPDQEADNKARNAAIELVENALRSGQIVQADRDMRIDQLRRAHSMQDVDLVVRDLRTTVPGAMVPPPPVVSSTPPPAGGAPWPLVNYGPSSSTGQADFAEIATVAAKTGRAIGGIITVIVLLAVIVPIVGAVIAFTASRDSFPDFDDLGPTDESTYLPGQPAGEDGVNVHSAEGFRDLTDALQEQTKQRFVYDAVLYPRYAVLEVPTGTNTRYQNWYWDGSTLEIQDIKSTSTDDQFDLTLIEPQLMIDLLNRVRGNVDDPTNWYVVISDRASEEVSMTAYASNDFGENAYLTSLLDGTITYDSTTQQ